ncbi:MAG: S-methyl-5-thioribose-1-phosphate isomerase [Bacillota bacterium]|nr:S-methyl-5-thioribose-1-phosphate isomerase [Bacillota bacterium]
MKKKDDILTMFWSDGCLHLLDQRRLPLEAVYRKCCSSDEVIESIKDMTVRGAPAIGIAAAYGMAIAARETLDAGYNSENTRKYIKEIAEKLRFSRPTAVNLTWAVDCLIRLLEENSKATPDQIFTAFVAEAERIHSEDIENNYLIGKHGSTLIKKGSSLLTHCNAGALATGGYGTAVGVIRTAFDEGKVIKVYVDETRPLLQGARITAFEMLQLDIPAVLITDNSAGYLMSRKMIDAIIVGADRIAANGDTANKIGTYSLAVLANYHQIPFYVAAPLSTIDLNIPDGNHIVIEERSDDEVTKIGEYRITPEKMGILNPAFDVTPAELITAIITEKGVIRDPDLGKIKNLFKEEGTS